MTKCQSCHNGLNSSYIRVGAKESFKKIGLYCIACDIYYSTNFQKQYTVQQSPDQSYNQNQTGPVGLVIDILRVWNADVNIKDHFKELSQMDAILFVIWVSESVHRIFNTIFTWELSLISNSKIIQ